MKRLALLASLTLVWPALGAAPAAAQPRPPEDGGPPPVGAPRRAYGNPSAGIAADIELARMTGEKKGRWFALRKMAAPDAIMFAPRLVLAQSWLKDRAVPAPALKMRPYRAWASCDGSTVVTSGFRREGGGEEGWYTTVWQREEDGAYRWVFDHGGRFDGPQGEPDMIEGRVAECPPRPAGSSSSGSPPLSPPRKGKPPKPAKAKPVPIVLDPAGRKGRSQDGSLVWEVAVDPAGGHRFTASMRVAGEMTTFRDEKVGPGRS